MRILILMLVAALAGAGLFHLYYLRQGPAARCGWDHPLDAQARVACRDAFAVGAHGYAAKARRDLDSLIGRIAH